MKDQKYSTNGERMSSDSFSEAPFWALNICMTGKLCIKIWNLKIYWYSRMDILNWLTLDWPAKAKTITTIWKLAPCATTLLKLFSESNVKNMLIFGRWESWHTNWPTSLFLSESMTLLIAKNFLEKRHKPRLKENGQTLKWANH